MSLAAELQPDQNPELWNNHVTVYEEVFEPLTNAFATHALDRLNVAPGDRLIDIGAGAGGAALIAAGRGGDVVAIDASPQMVARIVSRGNGTRAMAGRVRAAVMDGMALGLPDGSFDAAISVFGIILFPDADVGMRELARVLKPSARAAIVTWTETERYELAARLLGAIAAVRGPQPPPASLPAQLRYRDKPTFHKLLSDSGLVVSAIVRVKERWRLPSAR
jgi:ubiquinone/menaquinone biosynthesis C-methylase UbiE